MNDPLKAVMGCGWQPSRERFSMVHVWKINNRLGPNDTWRSSLLTT